MVSFLSFPGCINKTLFFSSSKHTSSQMDLSSLEGPPIHDPRFTISPNLPHIRLDAAPPSHSTSIPPERRLPSRPASTDNTPLHGIYYHAHDPARPSRHSLGIIHRGSRRRRSLGDRVSRGGTLLPQTQAGLGHRWRLPYTYTPNHADTNTHTNHLAQPPNSNPNPAGQLVWLETENMWIVADELPATQGPDSRFYPSHHITTHHYQPDPVDFGPWTDPPPDDDLPPSYESHYFDRVLVVQPVVEREAPPPPPVVVGDFRLRGDTSRWTDVARRVNRASCSS